MVANFYLFLDHFGLKTGKSLLPQQIIFNSVQLASYLNKPFFAMVFGHGGCPQLYSQAGQMKFLWTLNECTSQRNISPHMQAGRQLTYKSSCMQISSQNCMDACHACKTCPVNTDLRQQQISTCFQAISQLCNSYL